MKQIAKPMKAASEPMNLIHYSATPFVFDRQRKYEEVGAYKPGGFWVSVEGGRDWKDWCEAEGFSLYSLKYAHTVMLSEHAKILRVSSAEEMDDFQSRFSVKNNSRVFYMDISWQMVQKKYDGLIISPYQWTYRLRPEFMWYYGWDCASGVIWNLNAIQDVYLHPECNQNQTRMGQVIP